MVVIAALAQGAAPPTHQASAIVTSEFIAPTPPTLSAHASTIVETPSGLVAAWFGGTREGASDVGIWFTRHDASGWTAPVEVASGIQGDGRRFPCWNPVLFRSRDGMLRLFYKVGPAPARWWGMTITSRDDGATWTAPARLPDGILGPIKNKPVELANGVVVSPSSTESTDADPIWRVHFERSADGGATWSLVRPASAPSELNAIQPSVLTYADGRLQAVGRTRSGKLFETWSRDMGKTWSSLALLDVPNPNAGIDAVTLRDGRQLLVYNHTPTGRSPLNVAVSRDGAHWRMVLVLESEPGEYSYPAVIQTRDGLVHVTYTWRREKVKHVVIDPARLQ